MPTFAAFLAGLAFGLGLIVSGMANPAKVLGFLDLAGSWDPSLALVMASSIGIGLGAFAIARRRTESYLRLDIRMPTDRHIDRRLIRGAPNVEAPDFVEIGVAADGRVCQVLSMGHKGEDELLRQLVHRRFQVDGNEELLKDPSYALAKLLSA